MHRSISAIIAMLTLTACGTQAVITNLTTDQVVVTASGDDGAIIMAVAQQGCAVHKRSAVPISQLCLDLYCLQRQVLFACKAE